MSIVSVTMARAAASGIAGSVEDPALREVLERAAALSLDRRWREGERR
jgi:hypothetical protein